MKNIPQPRAIKLVICLLALLPVHQATVAGPFNLTEVSQGNYVHFGQHVAVNAKGHDDIANIGFITGETCVAVVDTGGSVSAGHQLLAAIKTVTDKPVCYVINTHVHFDHLLGNLAFVSPHTRFIGHEQLKDAVEANREFFLAQFASDLGPSPDTESVIAPGEIVQSTLTLDLGGKTLLLTAHPRSHTHTDLSVLDQSTQTLWTGDLVFRERIPVIDGSLKGWLAVMENLKKIPATVIIPGHGPAGEAWPVVLDDQQRYLDILLNETRQAVADGLFMEEAIDTIGISEKDHWLLFDQQHRTNVSKAFVELEWE